MTDITNPTVLTSIDELAAVSAAEARLQVLNSSNLTTTVSKSQLQPGQMSIKVPVVGSRTASALVEGDRVANGVLTTSGPTLTPAVGAADAAFISDRSDYASGLQLAAAFGRASGEAIVKKWNQDIFNLFAGFSASVGASGEQMTRSLLVEAIKKLKKASGAGTMYLVAPYEVLGSLLNDLIADNRTVDANTLAMVYSGQWPMLFGVQIVPFMATDPEVEDSDGDTICGLYSPRAIAMATSWEVKVGYQRQETAVGFDLVASSCYDVKEAEDAHGVKIVVANTAVASS